MQDKRSGRLWVMAWGCSYNRGCTPP